MCKRVQSFTGAGWQWQHIKGFFEIEWPVLNEQQNLLKKEEVIALTGYEQTKTRNVKDGSTDTVHSLWILSIL